jgi:hypothetical protein
MPPISPATAGRTANRRRQDCPQKRHLPLGQSDGGGYRIEDAAAKNKEARSKPGFL